MVRLLTIVSGAFVTGVGTAAAGAAIADNLFPDAALWIRVAFIAGCGILGLPAGGLVAASYVEDERR